MSADDTNSLETTNSLPIMQVETSFDDPTTDVILRTSDHVDFRVHRAVLSLASPAFRDIFALSVNISEEIKSDGALSLPVVDMTKDKHSSAMTALALLILQETTFGVSRRHWTGSESCDKIRSGVAH